MNGVSIQDTVILTIAQGSVKQAISSVFSRLLHPFQCFLSQLVERPIPLDIKTNNVGDIFSSTSTTELFLDLTRNCKNHSGFKFSAIAEEVEDY